MRGAPPDRPRPEPPPRTPSEFRAFVRRHHPDVGGDPEVFAAGVAAWRAGSAPAAAPTVVFYRKQTLLAQLLQTLLAHLPVRRRSRTTDRRAR
ncbi:MAG: hypothetical protein LH469_09555 [Frankiaceae bacterium]|nr:hypothetical protein [Frankiaceae bacterium]